MYYSSHVTMMNVKLLLYVLCWELLATLGHCTDFQSSTVAYVCESREEFSVIWPAPSNKTKVKICLYNLNLPDSKPDVLTEPSMFDTLSDGRQHLVFKMPPDLMLCKYYYKWKMETFLPGLTVQPTECSFDTPYGKCELEIGKSSFCPNVWIIYSVPIECQTIPRPLRFLPERCHGPSTRSPPPPEKPRVAIAVSVSVTVTLLAVIALFLYLRLKHSRLPDSWKVPAHEKQVAYIFKLPVDSQQWQRLLGAICSRARPQLGVIGHDHLLVNPDTGVRLEDSA